MAAAALAVVLLVACLAIVPYAFRGATLEGEVATQVRATTGLVISRRGPARFELLPHPHVAIQRLHVADPTGTLTIDAESLTGEVRLLPLLVGRLELVSATLTKPRLTIDLDGRPMPADSTIGRALRTSEMPRTTQRLGVVTLVDGTAVVKSRRLAASPALDGINVTIDWRDLESPASLTGALNIQAVHTDVAAWIGDPSSLLRGDHSDMTLRLHAAPLDVTATGEISDRDDARFRGRLSVSSPALPAVLRLGGYTAASPAPFANLVLTSDATIGIDDDGRTSFDLPSLHLRLDGNDYEGALAFQGGAKPSLSGTLATERLLLAPFLQRMPPALDADRRWTASPITFDHIDPIALDLRISATHLRLAPFTIDDAALAIMTRDDRTEIALVEGKAYGGAVKGRLSIGAAGGDLNLRAAGSVADADIAALSWDAFGRQVAAGTLSGSANLETGGDTPAALMTHLQGWAKGHASDGEISGVDLGRGLREIERQRLDAVLPALVKGRTPFQSLAFSARIADGIATIEDATTSGPDASLAILGQADIARRGLDLHAIASAPPPGTGKLRFDVGGTFDKVLVAPGATAPAPLP